MTDFNDDLDLDLDTPFSPDETPVKTRVYKDKTKHFARRFTSEKAIEEAIGWELINGECYHVISGGDIDSLSFLRLIARQQKIKYCFVSTLCMSVVDIDEIEHMITSGRINKIDSYVGEIFKGSYNKEWTKLSEMHKKHGGRAAIFRNHSKIMAGFGEKFDFAIESSANINTNPRTENTVITIDSGIAKFYKEFFDGITSFDRNFDAWKPEKIE